MQPLQRNDPKTTHFLPEMQTTQNRNFVTIYTMHADIKRKPVGRMEVMYIHSAGGLKRHVSCYLYYLTSLYLPGPYSLASVSPGSVTDAVQPSGMVKSHIHWSPSYRHALLIRPAAES